MLYPQVQDLVDYEEWLMNGLSRRRGAARLMKRWHRLVNFSALSLELQGVDYMLENHMLPKLHRRLISSKPSVLEILNVLRGEGVKV